MAEVKLNFVLIGNARCGKSTTGNAILSKKVFKASTTSGSATRNVDYSSSQFGQYLLQVVDTPRIFDREMGNDESETASITNMETAVRFCVGGVDAFLLILQFPCHITLEDRLMLKTLKKIFGDRFFSHVIVVVLTYGDLFEATMKDEGCNDSFEEWCGKQVEELRQLYDDCEKRFVLFNNIGTDPDMKLKQAEKMVSIAHSLQTDHGRYTVGDFKSVQTTYTETPEYYNLSTLKKSKPTPRSSQHEARANIDKQTVSVNLDQSPQIQNQEKEDMSETMTSQNKVTEVINEIDTKTKEPDHDTKCLPKMPSESAQIQDREKESRKVLEVIKEFNKKANQTDLSNIYLPKMAWKSEQYRTCSSNAVQLGQEKDNGTYGGLVEESPRNDIASIVKTQSKTQITELKFILMGKTGQGKSSTGNTLLNRPAFKVSYDSRSLGTRGISFGVSEFESYSLAVVDGICLEDVDRDMGDLETCMEVALNNCSGCVDAFLLVVKFGHPFTVRERSALDDLQKILGDCYRHHVIVVITGGDLFDGFKEKKELERSLTYWFMGHEEEFRQLCAGCQGRVMLFNNFETDEKKKQTQIHHLIRLSLDIRETHGQYSHDFFKQRNSSQPRQNVPISTTQIMCNKMIRLVKASEVLSETPSYSDIEKIQAMIHDLKRDLQDQDKDTTYVNYVMTAMEKIEDKLKKYTDGQKVELNILLIGKTGQGKSVTGNTILNSPTFKSSANTTSETKDVTCGFSEFGHFTILVVDGPGLEDTDLDKVQDREAAVKNIDKALAMCYGGVDIFLFVMKFGQRFTSEDRSALTDLKNIFGEKFLSHLVVVMTHGDLFSGAMKLEGRNISFNDWCREQKGDFGQLYKDCEERVVLFNNNESNVDKRQLQVQEIVNIAQELKARNGRYTSESFEKADFERKKLIIQHNAPELKREIQEKICLLVADIQALPIKPSDRDKKNILERIQSLKTEIEAQDQGSGVLFDMMKVVKKLESNVNNVPVLRDLANALENNRKYKMKWMKIGSVFTTLAHFLNAALPPLGSVAFAIARKAHGIAVYSSDTEKEIMDTMMSLLKQ